MTEMKYQINSDIPIESILTLYNDVGWAAYTSDEQKLKEAIKNSLITISVWYEDKLIGLLRAVGDGLTIIYIQDILVLRSFQRQGIGRQLLKIMLDKYSIVRQIVLMTDADENTIMFYESCGFTKTQTLKLQTFTRLLR
ncbi:MAG: GNAT family N-acetyltransferase [Sphingobacteriales bacterium]|nr:GNAT family N-acetyltransferase [Sphingobacteriales bacterium]